MKRKTPDRFVCAIRAINSIIEYIEAMESDYRSNPLFNAN